MVMLILISMIYNTSLPNHSLRPSYFDGYTPMSPQRIVNTYKKLYQRNRTKIETENALRALTYSMRHFNEKYKVFILKKFYKYIPKTVLLDDIHNKSMTLLLDRENQKKMDDCFQKKFYLDQATGSFLECAMMGLRITKYF